MRGPIRLGFMLAPLVLQAAAAADDGTGTVLARPLFSAARRPKQDTAAAAGMPAADLPRLVGTLTGAAVPPAATLQQGADGKQLTVHQGDRLGDLTVLAIRPAAVVLARPHEGGRVELRLSAARPAAGPAPNAPVPLPDPRERAPGAQDE